MIRLSSNNSYRIVFVATAIPWKHTQLPLNSLEKVDLTKTEITFASSMPNEYKVHSM